MKNKDVIILKKILDYCRQLDEGTAGDMGYHTERFPGIEDGNR